MYSYFCLVINLLSVLDNYGAYGQDNALEEEEDLTRYYKEDCYKPPLFGSNSYDPVKEIFHPLKHSKHEKDPAQSGLGDRGSSEGQSVTAGSTVHTDTSTTNPPGADNEEEKKQDPESYLRHSVKHQLVTLSPEPAFFKHYTKLVSTTEDSAYFRHSSEIVSTSEKPATHFRHSDTTITEDISNTTKSIEITRSKRIDRFFTNSRNRKKVHRQRLRHLFHVINCKIQIWHRFSLSIQAPGRFFFYDSQWSNIIILQ